MTRRVIFVSTMLAMLLGFLPANADTAFEDWNNGVLNGWSGNSSNTSVAWESSGGVDDSGYLSSQSEFGIIGAVHNSEPYIGDYGDSGYDGVRCSLKFFSTGITEALFRVRYLSTFYNGWYIRVTEDFTMGVWQTVTIKFDPTWSDEDALAAGWVQEAASATFAETMANVYTCEIRVLGVGSLSMGMDNFMLSNDFLPTSTPSWDMVKSLYR